MYTTLILLPALFSAPVDAPIDTRPDPLLGFETTAAQPHADPAFARFTDADDDDFDDHYDREHHGWYLRVNGGGVTTVDSDGPSEDVEFDEGWLGAVAIGKHLTGNDAVDFGLELEGVYTFQDTKDDTALDNVKTLAAYLNGLFDFRLSDSFSIYAGAGIGAAWMDVGTTTNSLNDFNDENGAFLTWQAKAGVMWRLSSNTGLSLGYRFRNIDDNKVQDDLSNSSFDLQTEQHVIELGLTFGL